MEFLAPANRFAGTFKPVLDAKNRVTVPAAWRSEGMPSVFALIDEEAGILWLWPREELERNGQNVFADESVSKEDAREYRRFLFAHSEECTIDAQGRIVLPAAFVDGLGGDKAHREIVMVGVGERMEIWPAAKWVEAEALQKEKFNQLKKGLGL